MIKNHKSLLLFILFAIFAFIIFADTSFAEESLKQAKCVPADKLKDKWQATCYTCIVVVQLIESFMNGAASLYSISAEAGRKLLIFGFIIWAGFWGLKHLGSMAGASGSQMLEELVKMLFKIGVAYILIGAGIGTLVGYAINPILTAGADYANTVLTESSPLSPEITLTGKEIINTDGKVIPNAALNKIMLFAKTISNSMSTFMVIGSALNCFGFEHPWISLTVFGFGIVIPNLMLVLLGIIIWCIGFMLSLAVCYYLLDISFKLGFAVILLPIAIGLWPFPLSVTKGKVGVCVSLALNAAGIFVLLAITAALAVALLDSAFQIPIEGSTSSSGIQELFKRIDNDDKEYISNLFDITDKYIFILLFCLIAGFKIVGKAQEYADKFFSSQGMGGENPMHKMATAMTDKVTKPIRSAAKIAGNIAAHQTGKAIVKGAQKANKRFVAPTIQGIKQGAKEGFKQGQELVGDSKFAQRTVGIATGLVGSATGALFGGGKAFVKNEATNWGNMGERIAGSAKETMATGKDAINAIKQGNASGAINATAQTLGGAIKTLASTTQTTADISHKLGTNIQKTTQKLANSQIFNKEKTNQKLKESLNARSAGRNLMREGKAQGGMIGRIKVAIGSLQKTIGDTKGDMALGAKEINKLEASIKPSIVNTANSFGQGLSFNKPEPQAPAAPLTSKKLENLEANKIRLQNKLNELASKNAGAKDMGNVQTQLKTINQEINREKNKLKSGLTPQPNAQSAQKTTNNKSGGQNA